MIKFIAKDDQGNQTLGLGIVAKNVENLKKNMPIVFNLSEIGSPKVDSICIFYGEDERPF